MKILINKRDFYHYLDNNWSKIKELLDEIGEKEKISGVFNVYNVPGISAKDDKELFNREEAQIHVRDFLEFVIRKLKENSDNYPVHNFVLIIKTLFHYYVGSEFDPYLRDLQLFDPNDLICSDRMIEHERDRIWYVLNSKEKIIKLYEKIVDDSEKK